MSFKIISHIYGGGYNKEYRLNEDFHRTDGPALIVYNEHNKVIREEYYIDGRKHRTDGPAIVYYYDDGTILAEEYFIDDEYHRLDGPASIRYYPNGSIEYEDYIVNGKHHNTKGPASIYYFIDGNSVLTHYIVNDKLLSDEEFNKVVLLLKKFEEGVLDKLKYKYRKTMRRLPICDDIKYHIAEFVY